MRHFSHLLILAQLLLPAGGGANSVSRTGKDVPHIAAHTSDAHIEASGGVRPDRALPAIEYSNYLGESRRPAEREWTAGVVEKRKRQGATATLRAVRAGRNKGFDRVVFEFAGGALPGYHAAYVDRPVRACGSGHAVRVAGDGWLEVRLTPAQAHTAEGRPTVGRRELHFRFPVLRELQSTCDFEGEVTWVFGVRSPNHYRVLELSNPARLVVDISHRQ